MISYKSDGAVMVQVFSVIRDQLVNHFEIDTSDLRIGRSFQPTAQAVGARRGSEKYQIYLSPITSISTDENGFTDSIISGSLARTHNTLRLATYQIDCLANYDASDELSIEALDLCQATRALLMQLDSIESLRSVGINLHSATLVRPVFSITSERQFESTPNFDLTLTYNSVYTKSVPEIINVSDEINRV